MLILLLLQAGDFNPLRIEMKKFLANDQESAVFNCVTMTRLWNGQSINDEKEKGIILRCGEGNIACGLSK